MPYMGCPIGKYQICSQEWIYSVEKWVKQALTKLKDLAVFWDTIRGFRGWSTLIKILSSKEHLDWLKIDFNAAEIFTVQDHKYKKTNVNWSTYIVLKLRVKKVIYKSKI